MAHLLACGAEWLEDFPLARHPVNLAAVVGHAILLVVGDVVLVELALPVQDVRREVIGPLEKLFFGPFQGKSAVWLLAGRSCRLSQLRQGSEPDEVEKSGVGLGESHDDGLGDEGWRSEIVSASSFTFVRRKEAEEKRLAIP